MTPKILSHGSHPHATLKGEKKLLKIDYITQASKESKAAERHVTLKHVVVKTGTELRNACSVWRYSTIFLVSFTFAKQTGFLSPGRRFLPHEQFNKNKAQ